MENIVGAGILTAMADVVVADWGDDRELQVRDGSPFSEVLESARSPERNEWFRIYFDNRLRILLTSIVDSAYRLDSVLSSPSPAGVSVVEYNILRPMLEYHYRLFSLVQWEIEVADREQRAIEEWNADYKQFRRVAQIFQAEEQKKYFAKWEPILKVWYAELTGSDNIRELNVRSIFDRAGIPELGWPTDAGNNPINPLYQSGYSLFSAVEHGHLWAIQHLGMNDPNMVTLARPGLDDATILKLQAVGGTFLQYAYESAKQFTTGVLDVGLMNRLGSYLSTIGKMQVELEDPGRWRGVQAED